MIFIGHIVRPYPNAFTPIFAICGSKWRQFTPWFLIRLWGKTMALTDTECRKAQPKDKQYRLSDINGLSLRIDPNGKKYVFPPFIPNENHSVYILNLAWNEPGRLRLSLQQKSSKTRNKNSLHLGKLQMNGLTIKRKRGRINTFWTYVHLWMNCLSL